MKKPFSLDTTKIIESKLHECVVCMQKLLFIFPLGSHVENCSGHLNNLKLVEYHLMNISTIS
jgi:hypothetical protein